MTTIPVHDHEMAALEALGHAVTASDANSAEHAQLGYAQVHAVLAVAHELRAIHETLSRKPIEYHLGDPAGSNR